MISKNRYKCYSTKFDKADLILRDFLAADRTSMANERTLLAYIRTGLSIMAAGVGFIKLFDYQFLIVLGYACFPIGIFTLGHGFQRYIYMQNKIKKVEF